MRALRFHGAGKLSVENVPEPGAPRPGEVLLRPLMCGICGTDLHEYTDGPIVTPARPHPLTGAELPQIMGHEFSARVVSVGWEVTHVREGDLCTVMPLIYYRMYARYFDDVRFKFVPLNLPPGGVYVCRGYKGAAAV